MAEENRVQFKLMIPAELKQRIERYADESRRSLSAQMINLLEYALWHEDQSRMQSGLEPLREMTDQDRETLAFYRKPRPSDPVQPSQAEDLPFLSDDQELTEEQQAQAAEELEAYVDELAQMIAKRAIRKTLSLKRPNEAAASSSDKPLVPVRLTGRLGKRAVKLDDE